MDRSYIGGGKKISWSTLNVSVRSNAITRRNEHVKRALVNAYLTSDGTVECDKRCSITFAEQCRIPTPTELTCQLLLSKQRSLQPSNDTVLTSARYA